MAHVVKLQAEARTTIGKQVKQLRRTGYVPANIYGHGRESTAIQVEVKALQEALRHATATTLVDLSIGSGRATTSTVLVRDVQWEPVRRLPIHVDFFAVRMDEKLRSAVAVVLRGESPAAKNADVMLQHSATQVMLEGLPRDLPEAVYVDATKLVEIDQAVHARDLELPENVTLVDDPDELIVKVQQLRTAAEPEPGAEADAVEGAKAAGEETAEAGEKS